MTTYCLVKKFLFFTTICITFRLVEEAASAALEQKDIHSLWTIHMNATKMNNRALVSKVENFIAQLSAKK